MPILGGGMDWAIGIGIYTLCVCKSLSHVRLCATPQTAAHQAPPSLGFSRQEHWSGLSLLSPCQFLLYGKVNALHVYIYSLAFGFPSHLGHHRALSRVPCALQQVLICCLVTKSCLTLCDPMGLQPTRFLGPWDSPGKNTGMDCHSLLCIKQITMRTDCRAQGTLLSAL